MSHESHLSQCELRDRCDLYGTDGFDIRDGYSGGSACEEL